LRLSNCRQKAESFCVSGYSKPVEGWSTFNCLD
jgi:hypothetical protein